MKSKDTKIRDYYYYRMMDTFLLYKQKFPQTTLHDSEHALIDLVASLSYSDGSEGIRKVLMTKKRRTDFENQLLATYLTMINKSCMDEKMVNWYF